MTAKDILTATRTCCETSCLRSVSCDMPVFDVLPRLLDSPERCLRVTDGGLTVGIVTQESMLEGLGRFIAARDDSSYVVVECSASDYSASLLAHAVEDAGAHLVDLLSSPAADGRLRVTLRVRHSDPSSVVRSLERYDYEVTEAWGNGRGRDMSVAAERLLSLQTLLNV